jgi:tripartite-type tricarboxylate transporter receptor subunit TctC
MSSEVVRILNQAIGRSLESADLRERFAKAGSVPTASTPEEVRKRYEDWIAIFGKIAKDAGIQPH